MIKVLDKTFQPYMSAADIAAIVKRVAAALSHDYRDKNPLLCPVLTGSFQFAADLARALDFDAELSFVRYSSYSGMYSTGNVDELLGFSERCKGRHVIIIEDIVDSGISMEYMLQRVAEKQPASVAVCSLFFKPECFKKNFKVDYIGCSIPNEFIVGYGLDYEGYGRTYPEIYVYKDDAH